MKCAHVRINADNEKRLQGEIAVHPLKPSLAALVNLIVREYFQKRGKK